MAGASPAHTAGATFRPFSNDENITSDICDMARAQKIVKGGSPPTPHGPTDVSYGALAGPWPGRPRACCSTLRERRSPIRTIPSVFYLDQLDIESTWRVGPIGLDLDVIVDVGLKKSAAFPQRDQISVVPLVTPPDLPIKVGIPGGGEYMRTTLIFCGQITLDSVYFQVEGEAPIASGSDRPILGSI